MSAGGFFEDLFNPRSHPGQAPRPAAAETPEKGVPLRGREFDGHFYVRVDDVVALLEANRVLPKATRQLRTRVQRVKLCGNAVTPPAARDLIAAVVESLGGEVAA